MEIAHMNEQKLNDLIDAHRALAARSEALVQILKAVLPFVHAPEGMAERMIEQTIDAAAERMTAKGWDEEFQSDVQSTLADLGATWLAAGHPALPMPASERVH